MSKIEGFALRASILHDCQNYLGGGGGLGGSEKNRIEGFALRASILHECQNYNQDGRH